MRPTTSNSGAELYALMTREPHNLRHLYRTHSRRWCLSGRFNNEPTYFADRAVRELLYARVIYAPADAPLDQWYEVVRPATRYSGFYVEP